LQARGCLELLVLLARRLLRGTHLLPDGICVAVGIVDPIVLNKNPVDCGGQPGDAKGNKHSRCRLVGIVIVPQQHGGLVLCAGRESIYIGISADTGADECVERNRRRAGSLHARAAHQSEHAKKI